MADQRIVEALRELKSNNNDSAKQLLQDYIDNIIQKRYDEVVQSNFNSI